MALLQLNKKHQRHVTVVQCKLMVNSAEGNRGSWLYASEDCTLESGNVVAIKIISLSDCSKIIFCLLGSQFTLIYSLSANTERTLSTLIDKM